MISADDLVNWVFAWVLVGAVIWMLMYSGGLIRQALGTATRTVVVLVSIGSIIGWPVIVGVFFAGMWSGWRARQ